MIHTRVITALIASAFLSSAVSAADTAKPAETTEQRAARLLDETAREDSRQRQTTQLEADTAYQAGLKLMNDLEYEQAKVYFERAVAMTPNYAPAVQKLRTVNSLLGIHTERVAEKMRDLENDVRVKQQESMVVVQNLLQEARNYEERSAQPAASADPAKRADLLAEQIKSLQKARERTERARELLNYLQVGSKDAADAAADAEMLRRQQQYVPVQRH